MVQLCRACAKTPAKAGCFCLVHLSPQLWRDQQSRFQYTSSKKKSWNSGITLSYCVYSSWALFFHDVIHISLSQTAGVIGSGCKVRKWQFSVLELWCGWRSQVRALYNINIYLNKPIKLPCFCIISVVQNCSDHNRFTVSIIQRYEFEAESPYKVCVHYWRLYIYYFSTSTNCIVLTQVLEILDACHALNLGTIRGVVAPAKLEALVLQDGKTLFSPDNVHTDYHPSPRILVSNPATIFSLQKARRPRVASGDSDSPRKYLDCEPPVSVNSNKTITHPAVAPFVVSSEQPQSHLTTSFDTASIGGNPAFESGMSQLSYNHAVGDAIDGVDGPCILQTTTCVDRSNGIKLSDLTVLRTLGQGSFGQVIISLWTEEFLHFQKRRNLIFCVKCIVLVSGVAGSSFELRPGICHEGHSNGRCPAWVRYD